jgi:hypothetical protein
MMDIDQTTKDLLVIHRGHLFEELCNMSAYDLKTLKRDITSHKKRAKLVPDSSFKPNGSTHDTFIAMIDNALSKRSNWQSVRNALFPIRKVFNWLFGLTLEKHQYLGTCRKCRNRKLVKIVNKFWLSHWKWIIGLTVPSILTMIGLYIAWLALIKTKP